MVSIDQIHHTVMWKALENPTIRELYQRLYPGRGQAFGFFKNFDGKLSSEQYRQAYAEGTTRALLRLPNGSEVLPLTPNAAVHNGPHSAFTDAFSQALINIATDLVRNFAPAEFLANGVSPEQAAIDYATARERALRMSTAMDLVDGKLLITSADPKFWASSNNGIDVTLEKSAIEAVDRAMSRPVSELVDIHNERGALLEQARQHKIYVNPAEGVFGSYQNTLASLAVCPVAAVETPADTGEADDAAWPLGGAGMAVGLQRPWPLVECRGQPHERCLPRCFLRQLRAAVTSDGAPTPQSRIMNRRIRNRTSGGVGGRRGQPRLLPDSPRWCRRRGRRHEGACERNGQDPAVALHDRHCVRSIRAIFMTLGLGEHSLRSSRR